MLRPKKTIPGLVVAALALTGCGGGESVVDNRSQGTSGAGGAAGSGASGGATGIAGSSGAGGMAGSGAAGGAGGVGGIGGAGGMGGASGAGGADGPATLTGQGFQAFCMKLSECYSGAPYYSGCVDAWHSVDLIAQSLSSECDAILGSYFSCLGELTCEELEEGDYYSCYADLDLELMLTCSTGLELP